MTLVQTEHDYLTDNSLNSNSNSCSGETPKLGLADQIKQMQLRTSQDTEKQQQGREGTSYGPRCLQKYCEKHQPDKKASDDTV